MSDKKHLKDLLTRDARSGKPGRRDLMSCTARAPSSWENDGARAAHRCWFA